MKWLLLAHAKSIRQNIIRMIARNGRYLQQGLEQIFLLIFILEALIDPLNPNWAERDRIFLSTAHTIQRCFTLLSLNGVFMSIRDLRHTPRMVQN